MATRIHDLDLDGPLPDYIALDGRDRLWLVGWRDGRPVGATLIEPDAGRLAVSRDRLARAVDAFERAEPPTVGAANGGRRPPSVSVVVCTRDRPDRMPVLLDALARQTHSDFELVVVDNAPSDGRTRRVVRDRWPEARYVVDPVPGAPHARNVGARAAAGEVLAFTDDDCRPVPGWLAAIVRVWTSGPGAGGVTGPILPLELETPAQEALERRGGFGRGFRRRRFTLDSDDGPVHPVQAWRFGAGGSLAVSRACFEAIGGFDEALASGEDMDLLYRVVRSDRAIVYEPAAAVHHRHPPEWRQLRRRMFGWGWGYLTYLDKIARTDSPELAGRARREKRGWLAYQLRDRLASALRGDAELSAALVMAEIAGGLAGWDAYPYARWRAARRGAAHSPPSVAASGRRAGPAGLRSTASSPS